MKVNLFGMKENVIKSINIQIKIKYISKVKTYSIMKKMINVAKLGF